MHRFKMIGGRNALATGDSMIREVLALLIATGITAHASFRILHLLLRKNPNEKIQFAILFTMTGWLLVGLSTFLLLPKALWPGLYPWHSMYFMAAIAVFPTALAKPDPMNRWKDLSYRTITRVFLALGIGGIIVLTIRYLLFVRPGIEGVDFYVYVCTARDLVAGRNDLTLLRYFYFPGVYWFWKIPFQIGYGNLDSLQWWYLVLIAANTVAVGAVVQRTVHNYYAAILASLAYISYCSRSEGFYGSTEPLATFPVLIALFLWSGNSLLGRTGILRIAALGIAFGLALLAKQYAGLLAVGTLSLLITFSLQGRTKQITFFRLLTIPMISLILVFIGILLEGHGFDPLRISFSEISTYERKGDLWKTIQHQMKISWPLFHLSAMAFLTWLVALTHKQLRMLPWVPVLGFTCIAGYAALLSFYVRHYDHYGLLAGPMLILSVVIAGVELGRRIPKEYRENSFAYFLTLVLCVSPFVRENASSRYFYLWPINPLTRPQMKHWHENPFIAKDLATLRAIVKPGETVLLLPPRRNEIHFILQTRTVASRGYGWRKSGVLSEILQQSVIDAVLEIQPQFLDSDDLAACKLLQCDRTREILPDQGFAPIAILESMTLWRKK